MKAYTSTNLLICYMGWKLFLPKLQIPSMSTDRLLIQRFTYVMSKHHRNSEYICLTNPLMFSHSTNFKSLNYFMDLFSLFDNFGEVRIRFPISDPNVKFLI